MGLFSMVFGSTSSKYSKTEHALSAQQIKILVSQVKVKSLTDGEEDLVESTIMQRRHGDGKISLFQIYEALTKLKNKYKISVADRNGLMKVFQDYFQKYN